MSDAINGVSFTDRDQIAAYLDMLFGYVDFQDGDEIRLRGLGEKGTDREGEFREVIPIYPLTTRDPPGVVQIHASRWNAHHIGAFLVPAVMHGGDKEENVRLFTTLVVDLDTGDTFEKLKHIQMNIGPCSMEVYSGGVTETGHHKVHAYWRLNEPTANVKLVGELRDMLALKVGDDPSFKRITQVIRIPGTTHGKNGQQAQCRIANIMHSEYMLDGIAEQINDMHYMPGVVPKRPPLANAGGSLNFAQPETPTSAEKTTQALTSIVHAGGVDGTTRWDSFSTVAGHHLHGARRGDYDIGRARELTRGWMLANMVPPWAEQRFDKEWRGLLEHDVVAYGPMQAPEPSSVPWQQGAPAVVNMFHAYALNQWVRDEKIEREWIVEGLIAKSEPHLFAAQGGAGKTYAMLDLAYRIAQHHTGQQDDYFWGRKITDHAGGTVVMITTEDSRRELAIRVQSIDPNGVRKELGTRLIVYPTVSAEDGPFTICEHDRHGDIGPSKQWQKIVEHLRALREQDNLLVIIDTLNAVMHSDENSSTTANEFRRYAFRLCAEDIGATVIFTHHLRKPDPKHPITSPDSLLPAIRGSSGLPAAFRIVIGMWEPVDAVRRSAAMGIEYKKGRLWFAQIAKANIHGCHNDSITLLRNEATGVLIDVTAKDAYRTELRKRGDDERRAWLFIAVKQAAIDGHPFTATGQNGPFARLGELPPLLRTLTKREWVVWLDALCEEGVLVRCNMPHNQVKNRLDVDQGTLAKAIDKETGSEYRVKAGKWNHPLWSLFEFSSITGLIEPIDDRRLSAIRHDDDDGVAADDDDGD